MDRTLNTPSVHLSTKLAFHSMSWSGCLSSHIHSTRYLVVILKVSRQRKRRSVREEVSS